MAATRVRWCVLGLALLCAGIDAAAAQDGKTLVMRLATPTLNDGQHEWMKRFAAAIEQKSDGRVKAELYPAGQLGSISRMIESTQLGSIHALIAPPEFLVGVDPRFELMSAAGLFDGEAHAVRVTNDPIFRKEFLAVGANKGLVGAGLFIGGPAAFATRFPFRTLGDMQGKKIRVFASPFQIDQITALGATAVPMSLGDVLPALQQGTIDGSLGAIQVFTALAYYNTTKYMNELGQAFVFSIVVISKRWLDTVPPDLQATILAAAEEVSAEINPWEIYFLERQRKTWVEKGGELNTLSAANRAESMARTSPIADEIVKANPELKSLWDQLKMTAKRTM
jgi:TRAP-type transport system periplasmic protein